MPGYGSPRSGGSSCTTSPALMLVSPCRPVTMWSAASGPLCLTAASAPFNPAACCRRLEKRGHPVRARGKRMDRTSDAMIAGVFMAWTGCVGAPAPRAPFFLSSLRVILITAHSSRPESDAVASVSPCERPPAVLTPDGDDAPAVSPASRVSPAFPASAAWAVSAAWAA